MSEKHNFTTLVYFDFNFAALLLLFLFLSASCSSFSSLARYDRFGLCNQRWLPQFWEQPTLKRSQGCWKLGRWRIPSLKSLKLQQYANSRFAANLQFYAPYCKIKPVPQEERIVSQGGTFKRCHVSFMEGNNYSVYHVLKFPIGSMYGIFTVYLHSPYKSTKCR